MEKSPDAFRTISEVADWLGVPTHVLRFWESRFTQVKPVKRAGGRRYYRPSDMELIGGIKRLLHDDGMTIRGVQKMLREQGVKQVAALSPPLFVDAPEDVEDEVLTFIPQARSGPSERDEVQDAEPSDEAETPDLAAQSPEDEAAPEPDPVEASETAPEPEQVEDATAPVPEPEVTEAAPADPSEDIEPDDLADLEALDAPPTFRHVARATPDPAPTPAEDEAAAEDADAGDLLDLMQPAPAVRKPAPFIVEEEDADAEEDEDEDATEEPHLSVSSRLRFVESVQPGADADRLRIALDRARALRDSMASRHAE